MSNNAEGAGFSGRVKQARAIVGLTQAELAELVGTVPRQISVYESGDAMPRRKTLERLASVLATSVEWLLSGSGMPPQIGAHAGTVSVKRIPVLDWDQASMYSAIGEAGGAPEDYIPAIIGVSPSAFAIRINGTSMASADPFGPSFPVGTTVIFDPDVDVKSGDFVLCLFKGDPEVAMFRQLVMDGTTITLQALNSAQFPVIAVAAQEVRYVKAVAALTIL